MTFGFSIPNTPDSGVVNQNQAEPDSLDFYISGNRRTGVVSGMLVSAGSSDTIDVSSGEVLLNGVYYQYAGGTNLAVNAYSGSAFFDIVVARVNVGNGVITITPISGTTSNPRFPSVGTGSGQVNPNTDVVLASVWRDGTSIDSGRIVDKRVLVNSNPQRKGGTPSSGIGQTSDLHVNTSWSPAPTGTNVSVNLASPLHVKIGSTWYPLAYWPSTGIPDIVVTTSTTAPNNSQGKDGDIWIRV